MEEAAPMKSALCGNVQEIENRGRNINQPRRTVDRR